MTPPSYRLRSLLFVLSIINTSTVAQNATNDTEPPCSIYNGHEIPVNSSGTVNVSDIYISVTFGESNTSPGRTSPWIYSYISAPENSTKHICATMFQSILKKKQATSANGCGGILSQNCIDGLKRQFMLPANNAGGMNADTKCPNFVASDSGIKSACGGTTIITGGTTIGTVSALNATNTTCSSTSTPQDVNWNLPSGYRTHQLFGISPDSYDTGAGEFGDYDEYVTSPVPIVISSYDGSEVDTQVVCVAPSNVVQGSHVPSAGASVRLGSAGSMAVVMAGVAAASLMLL